MRLLREVAVLILCLVEMQAQSVTAAGRRSPSRVPACASGAICFSGEVVHGREFVHPINQSLDFFLEPGWTIAVVPRHAEADCKEYASVVNAPYRQHRELYIDTSYGWTAEEEVNTSPREFRFVTNCADNRTEFARLNIVLWGYNHTEQEYKEALAKLGSSPLGTGRLWITASKITHASHNSEDRAGRIEWMKFAVEIWLPK